MKALGSYSLLLAWSPDQPSPDVTLWLHPGLKHGEQWYHLLLPAQLLRMSTRSEAACFTREYPAETQQIEHQGLACLIALLLPHVMASQPDPTLHQHRMGLLMLP